MARKNKCQSCFEEVATHFILENGFYHGEMPICCNCHEQCIKEGWHEKDAEFEKAIEIDHLTTEQLEMVNEIFKDFK